MSGFFDTVGLYSSPTVEHHDVARGWIAHLGVEDLVSSETNFFHLSFGQQKLVLLCRAMVKSPRLLLLDEPTHGLSGRNRDRFLVTLKRLAASPDVAVIYVTHREDEVDFLGFDNVLALRRGASASS